MLLQRHQNASGHWIKTRRSLAQFSRPEALNRILSLADFTTTTSELKFSVHTGMISINNFGLGFPETPFGGTKESGHGSEGGTEALEGFLTTKFISQMNF